MNIVIVGAGEVGIHIASQLVAEQKDVVIIEKDPERARRASNMLDCLVVEGEGTNVGTLIRAGVEKTNIFIAATNIDEVNMISCLVASSEFKIPVKIARVRNVEYMKTGIFEKSLIGIDYIVNPEIEASYDIAQTVETGASSGVYSFEGTQAQLRDFVIKEDSPFKDKFVKDTRTLFKERFIIAGILRAEQMYIPSGDFKILEGDHVYIAALGISFNKIFSKAGLKGSRLKSILMVGGGMIGKHVAGMLLDKGRDVRLIEKDYERCKAISALFPDVTVINGDISDRELFDEENLASDDAMITTTQNEELNILAGLYGKSRGIKRAVALIDKINYMSLAANLGIDSCVSPKLSSVDAILKFIRRGDIKNVYTIFDGQAEAIEFTVSAYSMLTGRAIKDLKLPENCLIVTIQRHRKTIIPAGDFVIEGGDNIIAFVAQASISKLENILAL